MKIKNLTRINQFKKYYKLLAWYSVIATIQIFALIFIIFNEDNKDFTNQDYYHIRNALLKEVKEKDALLLEAHNTNLELREFYKYIPTDIPLDTMLYKSGFGMRYHPIDKEYKHHYGIDFRGEIGDTIRSTASGIIEYSKMKNGYGLIIKINHLQEYNTLYAHLSKSFVKQGQLIKQGDAIGLVGMSGDATAEHLHYEVHKNFKKIDPILFIKTKQ